MPRDLKKRRANNATDGHIPRPPNCFMIFRAEWLRSSTRAKSTIESKGRQKQKDISQQAATAWKDLSPALKQLYKVQADIIKDEHSQKYPGWAYKPGARKRKNSAVDAPQDDSPGKRVARNLKTALYGKPSVDAEGKGKVSATHLTQATAPVESVWDCSWFSRGSSMKDPFYSTPLQPLASSTTTSPPMIPPHPHFFLLPAQMNAFGAAQNFTIPPMYHPAQGLGSGGLYNPEQYRHNTSILTGNTLSLSDSHPLPQATVLAEPPVSSGPWINPPNPMGESTRTAGSSMDEVLTPGSEADPPTQGLVEGSDLTYDKFLESFYDNNNWEVDFNQHIDPSLMAGL